MAGFTVIGYRLTPPKGDFDVIDTGAYWRGNNFSGVSKEDYAKLRIPGHAEIGIWLNPNKVSGDFSYFFGPMVPNRDFIPKGMEPLGIPAAQYAVFPVEKADTLEGLKENVRKMWKYVFNEWLDSCDYDLDEEKVSFEYYLDEGSYLYVPVLKKQGDPKD